MTYRIPVPEFARLEWRTSGNRSVVDMIGLRLTINVYEEAPKIVWMLSSAPNIHLFDYATGCRPGREVSGIADTEDDARRAVYDAALRLIDAALLDIGGVRL